MYIPHIKWMKPIVLVEVDSHLRILEVKNGNLVNTGSQESEPCKDFILTVLCGFLIHSRTAQFPEWSLLSRYN